MIVGFHIEYSINDVKTDATVLRRISNAYERAGLEIVDFDKHLWPLVTEALETEERRQFSEEGGGPNRGAWEALSPDYGKWKSQHYPGHPILQRTGALVQGLTDSSSQYAQRSANGDALVFGTIGLPYASFHQLGTSRMPDRPPFDFSADLESDLQRAGAKAVRSAVAEAKLDEFVEVVD